jgi:hypothetical protein
VRRHALRLLRFTQTVSDREGVAERFQRLRQIALRHQYVADTLVGHRQVDHGEDDGQHQRQGSIRRVGRGRGGCFQKMLPPTRTCFVGCL